MKTLISTALTVLMAPRVDALMRRLIHLLSISVVLAIGAGAAQAHPHVWVTAASELIFAADGSITGVRHAWIFDDMFSTYALQGLKTKKKGVYTREELAPLAQTNMESLKEFAFFTFARVDNKKQKFADPIDYYLEYKDAALVLHFTLPFKTPVRAKQLVLEIFDPSYFVDFSLQKKDPIRLIGAPANCTLAVQRPSDGSAIAQKLNEDTFLNGVNANFGAMFANKISVDCP